MSDQAIETKVEATYAQKMAFKRAYLEAMRNMATISAYVFAIAYIGHRHLDATTDKAIIALASGALTVITWIGVNFAMDLLWEAIHLRYPRIRERKVVRLLGALALTIISMAPTYLTYFKGE